MKYLNLLILIFLSAVLTKAQAQTASSTQVSKYYSSQVKQKLAAGEHPAPANRSQHLPSENQLPKKAIDLGKDAHMYTGKSSNRKLPGDAPVNISEVRSRNEKWINKKGPAS